MEDIRILSDLQKELEKAGEDISLSEVTEGKKRLPKLTIGGQSYTYDKEKRILRDTKTREEIQLTGEGKEFVDFIIRTTKRLKRDLNDASAVRRMIARRAEALSKGRYTSATKLKKAGI